MLQVNQQGSNPSGPQSASPAPTPISPPQRAKRPPVFHRPQRTILENMSDGLKGEDQKIPWALPLAFVLFFLVFITYKVNTSVSQAKNLTQSSISAELDAQANSIARALDGHIGWMDTGLAQNAAPNQIVNFVSRGNGIAGAAIIDSNNTVISATPNAGDALSTVSLKNFPSTGISITSVIAKDGTVNPVIIKKHRDAYLAVALFNGSLTRLDDPRTALILPTGRVIDGNKNIGLVGPLDYFDLSKTRLALIAQSAKQTHMSEHTMNSEKVWLATRRIPGSSLTLLQTPPQSLSGSWKKNLAEYLVLFGATLAVIWALLSNLRRQMKSIEATSHANEVTQQRYRAAIESNRGGVWEIDFNTNEAYITAALAKLFGLPEKDHRFPVPQFLSLFHEGDREKLYSHIRRAHMSGPFEADARVAHLPIVLSCRGKPTVRGDEQSKVILGMAMDVTEQRGAQTRLQAAEARLFDALGSMTDSFVIWDPMHRLVLWNNRFEDFYGFTPGQLQVGMEYATVEYHANKSVANTTNSADNYGYEMRLNDGRWIRYVESETADGGRVSVGTEITEIRTREDELRNNEQALQKTVDVLRQSQVRIVELAENYEQEKIRAEEASQSKSEFLANMSHELRTPLNAINGFSDIMQKELFGPLGDPRYKEYVNDILFSGQHLLSLINDILDMSKIEAGKMTLNTEVMQMHDMVAQVIRIVRGRADENRLKLLYSGSEMPEIEADPRAVKQILLNLTTNAIKFTPEGGTVNVSTTAKSAGLIIRVQDSGIGISAEDIKRLAEPFTQIDSQHSRQHEGTGLGLALSKSLVEMHGGNFKIESEVGKGTVVTFTLPNRPPEQKVVTATSEVGNEISRLAQDIADVLSTESVENAAAENAHTAHAVHPAQPLPSAQTASAPPPRPAPQQIAENVSEMGTAAHAQTPPPMPSAPSPPPLQQEVPAEPDRPAHYPQEYKPGSAA